MNKKLKTGFWAFLLTVMCFGFFSSVTAKEGRTFPITFKATRRTGEARAMLKEVNALRTGGSWYWNSDDATKHVIAPGELEGLQLDPALEEAAMKRAEEIAVYYSHTRPNGSSCFTVFPKNGSKGENLVYLRDNYMEAFLAWKEDGESYEGQGHRRNMLQPEFKYIGIGCVEKDGVKYWAQAFSSDGSGRALPKASDTENTVTVHVASTLVEDEGIVLKNAAPEARSATPVSSEELEIGQTKRSVIVIPYVQVGGQKFEGAPLLPTAEVADPSVVSYSNGALTGLKAGKTKIKFDAITFSGKTASKYLSVQVNKIRLREGSKDLEIKWPSVSYIYTGQPLQADPILFVRGKQLEKNKDYILDYKNNVSAGTASVTVKGVNDYSGELNLSFRILPVDASRFPVSGVQNKKYTGSSISQNLVIKNPLGELLKENIDYTVSYENNITPGEASIKISYIGNYNGGVLVFFLIEGEKVEVPQGNLSESESPALTEAEKEFYRLRIKSPKRKKKGKIKLIVETSTGYVTKLQYALNKKMKKAKTVKIHKNKTVIKRLKFGKTYYVRLGLIKDGKFKWEKVKKVK